MGDVAINANLLGRFINSKLIDQGTVTSQFSTFVRIIKRFICSLASPTACIMARVSPG